VDLVCHAAAWFVTATAVALQGSLALAYLYCPLKLCCV
jgi:hypothetical protein